MSLKPNVFIVCTGVGHINRGYESFTKECYEALYNEDTFQLYLLKGGGKSTGRELHIPCVKRNTKAASRLAGLFHKSVYVVEQGTFLLGMLPAIIRYKPAVIFYSDFILGTYLWHLRRFFKFKYKLLFSNGAPNGPPYKTEDHIQQLLPTYVVQAQLAGTEMSKQTLLPYAINIDTQEVASLLKNRSEILNRLKLPADKKIIISVGAINSHHKRIDYLINEFSLINNGEYFLVVLGQIDEKSQTILQLAAEKLGVNYLIKEVPGNEVRDYLIVADYFILASLNEGLPRVLPEALSVGLLPIVHDYAVTRETLLEYGVYRDLRTTDILKGAIAEVDKRNLSKMELIEYAYENYSWDKLSGKYSDMIQKRLS